MGALSQLTHLVYQFGPFAFALLFLIYMARWGQKKWQEASSRVAPPAESAEKRTYLGYFIGVTLVGVVLVAISVVWWWTHRPVYLYEGQIEEVSELHSIEGKNFFARNDYYQQERDSPQFRDVHFMLVQNEPFLDGEEIKLRHRRDQSRSPLMVRIKLDEKPTYGLVYDAQKDQWVLVKKQRVAAGEKGAAHDLIKGGILQLIGSAFAGEMRSVPPSAPRSTVHPNAPRTSAPPPAVPPRTPVPSPTTSRPGPAGPAAPVDTRAPGASAHYTSAILSLQEPGSPVSKKLEALNAMRSIPRSEMGRLLTLTAIDGQRLREPVFVTLMDLTRHTDREIASKAGALLVNAPLPTAYFLQELASRDEARINQAVQYFLRLEPAYAGKVLAELDGQRIDARRLKQASDAGQWKLVVPTGTLTGDKYYLKAQWNDRSMTCLDSELSAPWWGNVRTQGDALLVDGDKFRMLTLASTLERCGARANFVGYYGK